MRLIETIEISKDFIKKDVLVESAFKEMDGIKDLPIYETLEVPLWAKEGFNRNHRNYSKLFSQVISESKTTLGMVDHVEGQEESFSNVVLICRKPHMMIDKNGREWLAIWATLVGKPMGENASAILNSNGFLSFSSVCDGQVVDGYVEEKDFAVYRFCDLVLNPSNNLLLFKDDMKPSEGKLKNSPLYDDKESISESTIKLADKNLTIIKEDNKENIMSEKTIEKLLETNIKSMIKDADKTESLVERKTLLESALDSASDLSTNVLKEAISAKITETELAIHALAEKGKTVDSLQESITTLSTEKESVNKDLETIKSDKTKLEEEHKTLIALYEKKQYEAGASTMATIKTLRGMVTSLKNTNKKLAEKNVSLETSQKKLRENVARVQAQNNTMIDADIVASLKEDNDILLDKVISLTESLKKVQSKKILERRDSVSFDRKSNKLADEKRNSRFEQLLADRKHLREDVEEDEEEVKKPLKEQTQNSNEADVDRILSEKRGMI